MAPRQIDILRTRHGKSRFRLIGATSLLLTALAASAEAQERTTRSRGGFAWGLGLGGGHLEMDCGRCQELGDSLPYAGGNSIQFGYLVGGSVSPQAVLAVGGVLNMVTNGREEAVLASGGVVFQIFPRVDGRLFLRGGFGLGEASLANGRSGDREAGITVTVAGAHLELGMDLWRKGNLGIGPYVGGALSGKVAGPWRKGAGLSFVDPPEHPSAVYAGVSATWY